MLNVYIKINKKWNYIQEMKTFDHNWLSDIIMNICYNNEMLIIFPSWFIFEYFVFVFSDCKWERLKRAVWQYQLGFITILDFLFVVVFIIAIEFVTQLKWYVVLWIKYWAAFLCLSSKFSSSFPFCVNAKYTA